MEKTFPAHLRRACLSNLFRGCYPRLRSDKPSGFQPYYKICKLVTLLLEPAIGNALQLLHPFRLCNCAIKTTQEMNVVLHSADDQRRTFQRFGNATELCVQLFTNDLIAKKRAAFLC